MLLLILSLGACSEEKEGELCFVGDSLVAGWDVKDAFPTWIVRNDGVSGAKLEEIATWNLNYQDKNVVMLIGTNNLGGKLFNDATRQEFITDFVDEYKRRSKDWLHVGCSLFLFYLEIERSITRI